MLELKIQCENTTESHVYLNAFNYLRLLEDMRTAFRNAMKHGTTEDVVKVAENFFPDITAACDHHTGAY